MEATGISELKDKSVKQLSGGQKQRVAIARVIVTDGSFKRLSGKKKCLAFFKESVIIKQT